MLGSAGARPAMIAQETTSGNGEQQRVLLQKLVMGEGSSGDAGTQVG